MQASIIRFIQDHFAILYGSITLVHLLSRGLGDEWFLLQAVTKPMILVSLIIFFILQTKDSLVQADKWIGAALVFSLMGDLILLGKTELFFMLGLGAFLVAQLTYSRIFWRQRGTFLSRKPAYILLFLGYAIGLLYLLIPRLGNMLAPVLVYALAISLMGITALNRNGFAVPKGFRWVLAGAILFIVSDTLIALNKFLIPLSWADIGIMSTYAAAQYFLVRGYLAGPRAMRD